MLARRNPGPNAQHYQGPDTATAPPPGDSAPSTEAKTGVARSGWPYSRPSLGTDVSTTVPVGTGRAALWRWSPSGCSCPVSGSGVGTVSSGMEPHLAERPFLGTAPAPDVNLALPGRLPFGWEAPQALTGEKEREVSPTRSAGPTAAAGAEWGTADAEMDHHWRRPPRDQVVPGEWKYLRKRQNRPSSTSCNYS